VAQCPPLSDVRGSERGTPLHTEPRTSESGCPDEEALVTLTNRLGLHARPAAQLVRLARRYRAQVTLDNVAASSINAVLSLGRAKATSCESAPAAPTPARRWQRWSISSNPGVGIWRPAQTMAQAGGIAASAGIAIGPLVKLRPAAVEIAPRPIGNPEAEQHRLTAAIHGAREETRALYEWSKAHIGADEAGIFDAQSLFLEDPELLAAVSRALLEDRVGAESSWRAETPDSRTVWPPSTTPTCAPARRTWRMWPHASCEGSPARPARHAFCASRRFCRRTT